MAKSKETWRQMIEALTEFKRVHGHVNVPMGYEENPRLGRWVASRRYRCKIGDLPQEQIDALDALDFVWRPADRAWDAMYESLLEFKRETGHCNVPEHWQNNPSLANWVQSQRHKRRRGQLRANRQERLEAIDFTWAIYKSAQDPEDPEVLRRPPPPAHPPGQRLYAIRNGEYIQWGGEEPKPPELREYLQQHGGEFPPFVPLPKGDTIFHMGVRHVREQRIHWDGERPLPKRIIDYVSRNRVLPPHTGAHRR